LLEGFLDDCAEGGHNGFIDCGTNCLFEEFADVGGKGTRDDFEDGFMTIIRCCSKMLLLADKTSI
jgi:hypothetical protein